MARPRVALIGALAFFGIVLALGGAAGQAFSRLSAATQETLDLTAVVHGADVGVGEPAETITVGEPAVRVEPGPMMLGVSYVTIARGPSAPSTVAVTFEGAPGPRWSIQAVPGLAASSDGDVLELDGGRAALDFGTLTERTLVILALPPDERTADPERRTADRYSFTIAAVADDALAMPM